MTRGENVELFATDPVAFVILEVTLSRHKI